MKNLLLILVIILFSSCKKETLKISLPEEISQAKEGDLLIIEKVGDSIYIGFKPKQNE